MQPSSENTLSGDARTSQLPAVAKGRPVSVSSIRTPREPPNTEETVRLDGGGGGDGGARTPHAISGLLRVPFVLFLFLSRLLLLLLLLNLSHRFVTKYGARVRSFLPSKRLLLSRTPSSTFVSTKIHSKKKPAPKWFHMTYWCAVGSPGRARWIPEYPPAGLKLLLPECIWGVEIARSRIAGEKEIQIRRRSQQPCTACAVSLRFSYSDPRASALLFYGPR